MAGGSGLGGRRVEVEGLSANASTTPTMASKIAATTQPQIYRAALRDGRRGFLRRLRPPQPQTAASLAVYHPPPPHHPPPLWREASQATTGRGVGLKLPESPAKGRKNVWQQNGEQMEDSNRPVDQSGGRAAKSRIAGVLGYPTVIRSQCQTASGPGMWWCTTDQRGQWNGRERKERSSSSDQSQDARNLDHAGGRPDRRSL